MFYKPSRIEILAAAASGVIFALIFSVVLTSSSGQAPALTANPPEQVVVIPDHKSIKPRIPVEVLRVIDGDTVEVRAQIWLDQHITTKVRIRAIDAPELQSRCAQERTLAQASRERLLSLLATRRGYLTDLGHDKFGSRVVANIMTTEGQDVAGQMLSLGYARSYTGGRRQGWC